MYITHICCNVGIISFTAYESNYFHDVFPVLVYMLHLFSLYWLCSYISRCSLRFISLITIDVINVMLLFSIRFEKNKVS